MVAVCRWWCPLGPSKVELLCASLWPWNIMYDFVANGSCVRLSSNDELMSAVGLVTFVVAVE